MSRPSARVVCGLSLLAAISVLKVPQAAASEPTPRPPRECVLQVANDSWGVAAAAAVSSRDDMDPQRICVVMHDNRSAPELEEAEDLRTVPYISVTTRINRLYAKRHGYQFIYVDFAKMPGCVHPMLPGTAPLAPTWCKLLVVQHVTSERGGYDCELVLLLDTDAVVADFDQRLEDFADGPTRAKRTLIVAHVDEGTLRMDAEDLWRVHGIPPKQPWMRFAQPGGGANINAGVMVFQRGGRLRELLAAWWFAATKHPGPEVCFGDCLLHWPHEQAVLENFVWPCYEDDITVLPLRSMNGFSGRFVRHLWGAAGEDRRTQALLEELWKRDAGDCLWRPACRAQRRAAAESET